MTGSTIQLNILHTIQTLHNLYGLRNDDYTRYRRYLTRRLQRLYHVLNLTHGKTKFQERPITKEHLSAGDARYVLLLVLHVERAWSYAQARSAELVSNPDIAKRAAHHIRGRYKKCEAHCGYIEGLLNITSCSNLSAAETSVASPTLLEPRTCEELKAYLNDMRGRCALGMGRYQDALEYLTRAHVVYAQLRPPRDSESVEGAASSTARVGLNHWITVVVPQMQQLEETIGYTLEVSGQAASRTTDQHLLALSITPVSQLLTEGMAGPGPITWADIPISLSSTRISSIVRDVHEHEQNAQSMVALIPTKASSAKIFSKLRKTTEVYDRFFITCNDALAAIKTDGVRSSPRDGDDRNTQLLKQYITFRMLNGRIHRARVYIRVYSHMYDTQHGFRERMGKLTKQVAASDMVHLYSSLEEHVRELLRLPGLMPEQEALFAHFSLYARAGCLLFKGLAWKDLSLSEHVSKAYACLLHADNLLQQSLNGQNGEDHIDFKDDRAHLKAQITRETCLLRAQYALEQAGADGVESASSVTTGTRPAKRPRRAAADLPPNVVYPNIGSLASLEPRRELLLPRPSFFDLMLPDVEAQVPIDDFESALLGTAPKPKDTQGSNSKGWFSGWFRSGRS